MCFPIIYQEFENCITLQDLQEKIGLRNFCFIEIHNNILENSLRTEIIPKESPVFRVKDHAGLLDPLV
jgi:hypothetical protein